MLLAATKVLQGRVTCALLLIGQAKTKTKVDLMSASRHSKNASFDFSFLDFLFAHVVCTSRLAGRDTQRKRVKNGMATIEEWYRSMPVITRTYMTLCFITTLAVHIDFVSPLALYLNFHAIINNYQVLINLAFVAKL